VTSAAWVIGYFARRRIERTAEKDAIDLKTKALDLYLKRQGANLSAADVDKLTADVSRREHVREIEDRVASEVAENSTQARHQEGPRPGETQADLNVLSAADLRVARAMHDRTLAEAEIHCGDSEQSLRILRASQAAWEAYATAEAEYLAFPEQGGTLYPTILHSVLERLTIARIADLKAHIEWLKSFG
jgi:uncharacterized protein YecT (DUF1311 family)